MNSLREDLNAYLQQLTNIDAHEHLMPERGRVARQIDVLSLLSLYAWFDLMSAGLPTKGLKTAIGDNYLTDHRVPLEEKWNRVWPYIQRIKHGSYYRATAIALRDLYGIADLNERTWREANERVSAANRPGLYRSILRDRCHIRTCLVQNGAILDQDPADLFTPVLGSVPLHATPNRAFADYLGAESGVPVTDLDTYLKAYGMYLDKVRSQGAVGVKIRSCAMVRPDMDDARSAFQDALRGAPAASVLACTVLDFVLRWAGEHDWPVAVHCGVWDDFRTVNPRQMLDIVPAYPQTRFDLYHLGLPDVRDTLFIAKNYPNAYLNLCWCWVVSQDISQRAVHEILDMVPVNKVFAFGGDYITEVENVYGHLVMARESLAHAMSDRVHRGWMSADDAREVLRLWMVDNPSRFYGLKPA